MTELLILGVDGMNPGYTQKRIEEGDMPNLKQLQQRENTVYGEFESYICDGYQTPHTGPMWTSIYTGLKPEDHGLLSGGWNDGDSRFHVMNTVWDKLSNEDISMTLYGMPMTYKAKEINGEMVSGFVSTTLKSMWGNCIYPETLEEKLVDDFIEHTSSYVAKVKTEGAKPNTDTENFYTEISYSENKRAEQFKEIHNDRDVVAYGTTLVDKIGHVAAINEDSKFARESYILLDQLIGRILETVQPEHVMVISDHGFSDYSHSLQGYYLNTAGQEMDNVFDFTPTLLNHFGLEYRKSDYGPTEDSGDLTESEIEDVKDQLDALGYF